MLENNAYTYNKKHILNTTSFLDDVEETFKPTPSPESPNMFKTKSSTPSKTKFLSRSLEVAEDEKKQEIKGVIIKIEANTVDVKLCNETIIAFPIILFDKSLLEFGQAIKYQIIKRKDGTKFQRFVAREDATESKQRQHIMDIVDDFLIPD